MTAVDHAELKRLAEEANADNPSPWVVNPRERTRNGNEPQCVYDAGGSWLANCDSALVDAFIAAANPAVILALLSEIEGLKAERDRLSGQYEIDTEIINNLRTQAPDSWRPDREAVDAALKLATEGADKAGCDGWRSQEKCRQIVQLLTKALRPQTAESGK